MSAHEEACVRRRLGARAFTLQVRNALVEPAQASWLDDCDAFILGGSGDFSVHHPESQAWVTPLRSVIEAALVQERPGFGICFGHQLLGYHLGAPVETDPRHAEMGTVDVDVTAAGRQSHLLSGLPLRFPVHTGHSDCVTEVPPGVEVIASNARLHTQAFKVEGQLFYSVQFHPDMSGAEARARYLAYREGFAQRLDPSALDRAERFALGRDDSTALLGRFLDEVQASQPRTPDPA
jgi:GMP synthase (glutamine-hydrolysing)